MCHTPHRAGRAISLDHGAAHDHDHDAWTRRDFLVRAGLGSAALALGSVVGSAKAYAMQGGGLLGHLARTETDRILVLIQLKGGNDGLNTVVPVGNDVYHNARPGLRITNPHVVADGVGLHPALAPLIPMWGEGRMAIAHGVGYASPSLSHFQSTDVWTTARPVGQSAPAGGWGGRTLRTAHPDYETALPTSPPAVQIGSQNPLLFQSGDSDLSMMLPSAATIEQIAAGGGLYDPDAVPATPAGYELGFVRQTANAANRYVGAVQTAATAGTNAASYPSGTFATNLAATARLIKGGLGSRIYVVSLGGFDTHVNQLAEHANLLGQLAQSLVAFYADLAAGGHAERTLTMTFSEFGRRVSQNGSAGTDHGTSAPLFAFGPSVAGGQIGTMPSLSNLDNAGNLRHAADFRQAYAAVLGPWFGLGAPVVEGVLGGAYTPLPFVGAVTAQPDAPTAEEFRLDAPFPNPVRTQATVRGRLPAAGPLRLQAFDARGRLVQTVFDGEHGAGPFEARFEASDLPAGVYLLRLETGGASRSVRVTVVR